MLNTTIFAEGRTTNSRNSNALVVLASIVVENGTNSTFQNLVQNNSLECSVGSLGNVDYFQVSKQLFVHIFFCIKHLYLS